MTAAQGDLRVERWTPVDMTIPFIGVDFTGATASMQVRQYPDAPGTADLTLTDANPTDQGLSIDVTFENGIPTSILRIIIDEETIEGLMPFPVNGTEPGSEIKLAYAVHITPPSKPKRRWLEGSFIIIPGANQL